MIKIAAIASDYGEVTILRNRESGAVLYSQGLCNQSEADTKGISLASYVHAIFGLLLQAECNDVLMIGCGGGTLATMLRAADVRVAIVDINSKSFQIAHDYFHLPRDVVCHVADGRKFLLSNPHRYDAIVLDAYKFGGIPTQFSTAEFFRLVSMRLVKSKGCFMANICVNHDRDRWPDRFAELMKPALRNIRILDAEAVADRNAIVMGGGVRGLQRPILLLPPEHRAKAIALKLHDLKFRRPRVMRPGVVRPRLHVSKSPMSVGACD